MKNRRFPLFGDEALRGIKRDIPHPHDSIYTMAA
jgi:hypothetical protein